MFFKEIVNNYIEDLYNCGVSSEDYLNKYYYFGEGLEEIKKLSIDKVDEQRKMFFESGILVKDVAITCFTVNLVFRKFPVKVKNIAWLSFYVDFIVKDKERREKYKDVNFIKINNLWYLGYYYLEDSLVKSYPKDFLI